MLRIGRVTVAYDCLEMVTAACRSLRRPKLAIMYLVAHYAWIEHSVSSASIHYMTDTCRCAQQEESYGRQSYLLSSMSSNDLDQLVTSYLAVEDWIKLCAYVFDSRLLDERPPFHGLL